MKFKSATVEALRQKITSYDQLAAIMVENDTPIGDRYTPRDYGMLTHSIPEAWINENEIRLLRRAHLRDIWWWWREQMRMAAGVYPTPSNVLFECINGFGLGQYCIHVSTDPATPEAVSYTPDAAYGAADRQVKVSSLAKLLRKLVIVLPDGYLQKIEAAHRAELDPTFNIATSVADVEYVYQNMAGDGGCMRYDPNHWDLPSDLHPSHVYAEVPGMGVAFHKVDDRIVSRAVVWEDEQGNKKYLRVYGDAALRRKLERAGYQLSSLAGARIRAIRRFKPGSQKDEDYPNRYVVPYLDGRGGNQDDRDGTVGYIDSADPGFIRLVDNEFSYRLEHAGVKICRFKNHRDVVHTIEPFDMSNLRFTCSLSGIVVDLLNDSYRTVWLNGKAQRVAVTKYVTNRFNDAARAVDASGLTCTVHKESWVPTFIHAGYHWVESDAIREHLGYVRLDAEQYPGMGWVRQSDAVMSNGAVVLKRDCVPIYHADSTEYVHRDSVESRAIRNQMRAKGYHFVGRGMTLYAIHKDHEDAVELRGGRIVNAQRHVIQQLSDGTLEFESNTKVVVWFGCSVRILKTETAPSETWMRRYILGKLTTQPGWDDTQDIDSCVQSYLQSLTHFTEGHYEVLKVNLERRLQGRMYRGIGSYGTFVRTPDAPNAPGLWRHEVYETRTAEQLATMVAQWKADAAAGLANGHTLPGLPELIAAADFGLQFTERTLAAYRAEMERRQPATVVQDPGMVAIADELANELVTMPLEQVDYRFVTSGTTASTATVRFDAETIRARIESLAAEVGLTRTA